MHEHMRCSIPDSGFYSFPDKENSKFWNRENSKAPRYEWRIRINLRNDRFQNREHVGSQASFLSRRRHELCSRISYTTSLSRLHAKFNKLDLLRNSCLALEEYQRKIFLKSTEKSIHPSISKRLTIISSGYSVSQSRFVILAYVNSSDESVSRVQKKKKERKGKNKKKRVGRDKESYTGGSSRNEEHSEGCKSLERREIKKNGGGGGVEYPSNHGYARERVKEEDGASPR